MVPCSRH